MVLPSASVIRCGFSVDRVDERHLQAVGDVGALLRRARALAKAAEAACRPPARCAGGAEQAFEQVAEIGRVAAAEAALEALEPAARAGLPAAAGAAAE